MCTQSACKGCFLCSLIESDTEYKHYFEVYNELNIYT